MEFCVDIHNAPICKHVFVIAVSPEVRDRERDLEPGTLHAPTLPPTAAAASSAALVTTQPPITSTGAFYMGAFLVLTTFRFGRCEDYLTFIIYGVRDSSV